MALFVVGVALRGREGRWLYGGSWRRCDAMSDVALDLAILDSDSDVGLAWVYPLFFMRMNGLLCTALD